jgi:hypothetical protein
MDGDELTQLNVHVSRQLVKSVEVLADVHGWSKRETVTKAIEALVDLMERHEGTAARASNSDIGDLFLELASLMPAGLTDVKVAEARFSDGRPGLIVSDEWVVANDDRGALMVSRRDSGRLARVARGRIEVLPDPDRGIAEIAPLKIEPSSTTLD